MAADPTTAYLFNLLYIPALWSTAINGDVYQLLVVLAQIAQAHNVTVSGGARYTVPSVEISLDKTFLSNSGAAPAPAPNLTSYSSVAISGADNFNDDGVTIKDVFDTIVDVTRDVSSACEFPIARS